MASTPSSTTSNDLLPAYEDVVGTIPGQEEGTRSSISGVNEEDDPKTPTPTSRRSPLEKPIAIPQTRYGIGKPYVRAYSDELVRFDISKQQFMEFVDELNTVTSGSPAFDCIDAAGEVIGYTSIHDGGLIGMGLQLGAGVGKAGVSLIRERRLIKKVNEVIFGPVGLKAELLSRKKLKTRLGLPPETPLAKPLAREEWEGEGMGLHERRMATIQEYVATLSFDVPPASQPKRRIDVLNASIQRRALAKQEEKTMEARARYRKNFERYQSRLARKQKELEERITKLEARRSKKEQRRDERIEELKATETDMKRVERKLKEYEEEFQYEVKYIDGELKDYREEYEEELKDMKEELQGEDEEAYHIEKGHWILIQNL